MNLETWFKLKHSAYRYERNLGIDEWTEVEKSVLAFVAGSHGTTIEKIIRHEYFLQVSRSTIKRAVAFLKINDIITTTNNPEDKREMLLTYNAEETDDCKNSKIFLAQHYKEAVTEFIDYHNEKNRKSLKGFVNDFGFNQLYHNIICEVFYPCECNDDECEVVIPSEFAADGIETTIYFHNLN